MLLHREQQIVDKNSIINLHMSILKSLNVDIYKCKSVVFS